jgi:hypothetical protein
VKLKRQVRPAFNVHAPWKLNILPPILRPKAQVAFESLADPETFIQPCKAELYERLPGLFRAQRPKPNSEDAIRFTLETRLNEQEVTAIVSFVFHGHLIHGVQPLLFRAVLGVAEDEDTDA